VTDDLPNLCPPFNSLQHQLAQPVCSQTEVTGNRMSIRLGIKINEALPCECKYEILFPLS